MRPRDVIVIGAGVAGLSLCRDLVRQGVDVLVLERLARVGGRCTTWSEQERRADLGVSVLHGRTPAFQAALEELSGATEVVSDWPAHLRGPGSPCQPQAYGAPSQRLALAAGVSAFPELLARELPVQLGVEVVALALEGDHLEVHLLGGAVQRARRVVVTTPPPAALTLLSTIAGAGGRSLASLQRVLQGVHMLACLTVIAGYDDHPAEGGWHLILPEADSPIHSLINESSKRPGAAQTVLVIQGRPGFSRRTLAEQAVQEAWGQVLLDAAAQDLGAWAARPSWRHHHVWPEARIQRGDELSHPVLLRWPSGATLGLCGEAFHPAGGVEGAFLSGQELARRMLAGEATTIEDAETGAPPPAAP